MLEKNSYPDLTLESIVVHFQNEFKQNPHLIVRSPGRINLLGEHTDYNGGYVLPASINREIYFAISPREDFRCKVLSQNLGEMELFSMDKIEKRENHWSNYLKGVISQIQQLGLRITGFNLVFGGNIPIGAGVSSSAALETGMAFCLNELFNLQIPRLDLVKLCQSAENNFVGLQCGIMDMFASIMGKKDHVIRIDCRSLEFEYYPFFQEDYVLILFDSGVKHSLNNTEYNIRGKECERGLQILKKQYPNVTSLRDVSLEMLTNVSDCLEERILKRCRYVIAENERVISASRDLENYDLESFGDKMFETHQGLKKEYEVSCEELDFLVSQSHKYNLKAEKTILGSRMMGGGFGGCTINLVNKKGCNEFIEEVVKAYNLKYGRPLKYYKVAITEGTSQVNK
jgi:galactokinase